MGLTPTITLPVGRNLDNASLERIGNTTLELIDAKNVHASSDSQSGLCQFRNNLVSAQLFEEIKEHIFCIDTVRKARSSSFDRAANVVETATEDKVAEAPRNKLLIRYLLQIVRANDLIPQRSLIGHVVGERCWYWIGEFHVKCLGDARPH